MFKGSIVALVTPMTVNNAVDYIKFETLIDWHLASGTHGLTILGTTGEAATLTLDERTQLIQRAVSLAKGKVPIIVGTGANATSVAIELTQHAMDHGADAALLVTPYYNKPTQEGLFQHYSAVAKAVAIPQILYNVPGRTACDLLPETVLRLDGLPNIVALKDATGDMQRLSATLEAGCQMAMLTGDDASALAFMKIGGQGVITVAGNIVPRLFSQLCEAALKGDFATADQLDGTLRPLYEQLFCESNPIPTKWLLAQMGLIESGIRLPLTPLAGQYHTAVLACARQLGIEL